MCEGCKIKPDWCWWIMKSSVNKYIYNYFFHVNSKLKNRFQVIKLLAIRRGNNLGQKSNFEDCPQEKEESYYVVLIMAYMVCVRCSCYFFLLNIIFSATYAKIWYTGSCILQSRTGLINLVLIFSVAMVIQLIQYLFTCDFLNVFPSWVSDFSSSNNGCLRVDNNMRNDIDAHLTQGLSIIIAMFI